jgi:Uma2 family endonuclease
MSEVRVRPLHRSEFQVLVAQDAFGEDDRIELLGGELIQASPQKPSHAVVVQALTHRLAPHLPAHLRLRVQLPFAAEDLSEPEPDIAIVPADQPLERHPDRAVLIVEVADASLQLDLDRKARIYAQAGVPAYWVVDVPGDLVHVHADPVPGGYGRVEHHGCDDLLDACGVPITLQALRGG